MRFLRVILLIGVLSGSCASAALMLRPKGSTLGKSGFLTIRSVPPSPTGELKPERPTYRNMTEWYAQEEKLTISEAGKRLGEQQALQPVFERLRQRLAQAEAGNYVSAALVHQPDWSYVLYFKREPEATLRKYTVNPRFRAAKAAYTEAELEALAAPWLERFRKAGIASGYGFSATEGRVDMMMSVTQEEYGDLAARSGWGSLPPAIKLGFTRSLEAPRVDPRVTRYLRGFASESRGTTIQLEAGFSGRVILDDGCLRLASPRGKKGPLVLFHRETGIGLDAQGYLATINRQTGKATGRVGEWWSWAGPNDGTQFDGLEELKAACGDGPVVNVGNPESQARFSARYPRS